HSDVKRMMPSSITSRCSQDPRLDRVRKSTRRKCLARHLSVRTEEAPFRADSGPDNSALEGCGPDNSDAKHYLQRLTSRRHLRPYLCLSASLARDSDSQRDPIGDTYPTAQLDPQPRTGTTSRSLPPNWSEIYSPVGSETRR